MSEPERVPWWRGPSVTVGLVAVWGYGMLRALEGRVWPSEAWWPWAAAGALGAQLALASQRPETARGARPLWLPALLASASASALLLVLLQLKNIDLSYGQRIFSGADGALGLVLGGACVLSLAHQLGALLLSVSPLSMLRFRFRALAWASLALGAVLVPAALARAARYPRPYLATLESMGTLAPVLSSTVEPSEQGQGAWEQVDQIRGEGVAFQIARACNTQRCVYGFHPPGPLGRERLYAPFQLPNEQTELLRDPVRNLLILQTEKAAITLSLPPGGFHTPGPHGGMTASLSLEELLPTLSPPLPWAASAAGGAAAALALLLRGRRWTRWGQRLSGAREGQVRGGWIQPRDGGDDLPLPAHLRSLPEGRAVTLLSPSWRSDYRSSGDPAEVLEGSRADLEAEAEARLTWHRAMALASSLLLAAPLVAAWIKGLL